MEIKPIIIMNKPKNWNNLAFYQKIWIYRNFMNKFHSQFVDKINAKKIVKKVCKEEIEIPKVIRILLNYNDIRNEDINHNYLIKASHGSKWNINIEKDKKYNINEIVRQLKRWNKLYNPIIEKQYGYLIPKFFIEEKIEDKYFGKNGKAIVYMIRCIYGKIVSISAKYNGKTNYYNNEWELRVKPELDFDIEKPIYFEKMKRNAEKLSSFFEFVRIDFYIDKDDKIYFSEFTFSPMGGMKVLPLHLEYELSKYWY